MKIDGEPDSLCLKACNSILATIHQSDLDYDEADIIDDGFSSI